MNVCWFKSYNIQNFAYISTCSNMLIAVSMKCVTTCVATSPAAVGAPQGVSLERLILQGAVRVTWSAPTDLCGLTNPQYTIQYGKSTSTPTTHSSMPSSSPFNITGLEVGQEYFVRVAVRTQSGSGTFSSWKSVTTCEGVTVIPRAILSTAQWSNTYNIRQLNCPQHVLTVATVASVHFLAAVGVPRMVSLAPLPTRGAVRVTWSHPSDLCGLTNPQHTIQYGRTTSTPTTLPSTPSSSPFNITDLEVGLEYFVRVAVRTQSGSGTFSSWESVTTYEGVRGMSLHVIL